MQSAPKVQRSKCGSKFFFFYQPVIDGSSRSTAAGNYPPGIRIFYRVSMRASSLYYRERVSECIKVYTRAYIICNFHAPRFLCLKAASGDATSAKLVLSLLSLSLSLRELINNEKREESTRRWRRKRNARAGRLLYCCSRKFAAF